MSTCFKQLMISVLVVITWKTATFSLRLKNKIKEDAASGGITWKVMFTARTANEICHSCLHEQLGIGAVNRATEELIRLSREHEHVIALINLCQAQAMMSIEVMIVVASTCATVTTSMLKGIIEAWAHEQEHAIPTALSWQVIGILWTIIHHNERSRHPCKRTRKMNSVKERGKRFGMELVWSARTIGCRTLRATVNTIRGSQRLAVAANSACECMRKEPINCATKGIETMIRNRRSNKRWQDAINQAANDGPAPKNHPASRVRRKVGQSRSARLLLSWLFTFCLACAITVGAKSSTNATQAIALQRTLASCKATASGQSEAACHSCDSDSHILAVDNCSTRSMTNSLADCVSPPTPVDTNVKGIGGNASATHVGAVKWSITDDTGKIHEWLIPNTCCNKQPPHRLLSPQHWAQERQQGRLSKCVTCHDAVEMFWAKCQCMRTVPLDEHTNIALIRSQPSFARFRSFCAAVAGDQDDDPLSETESCNSQMVTDDEHDTETSEDDESVTDEPQQRRHPDLPEETWNRKEQSDEFRHPIDFGVPETEVSEMPEDEEVQRCTPQAEMLATHCRTGHLEFDRIKAMAKRGDLPRRLLNCLVPKCASCLCGRATRRPW